MSQARRTRHFAQSARRVRNTRRPKDKNTSLGRGSPLREKGDKNRRTKRAYSSARFARRYFSYLTPFFAFFSRAWSLGEGTRDERLRTSAWEATWSQARPVTSPLFWLFRPPMPTSINWQLWCQKDQAKQDPLLKNCHLSGYQKLRQQHKTKKITARAKSPSIMWDSVLQK